jgi:hypothetical protein
VSDSASGARVPGAALFAVALAFALVLAWSSPRWLPYNMDEFVHYQPLGCATAPLSERLGEFRESCHLYDLRLPFGDRALPLRSYLYIGSFPAVVFYPFWKVLQDPVAARVQGVLFLLVAGFLSARYLTVRVRSVALAGLVFPLVPTCFLADEGPVGLSIVLLLAALLLFRRSLAPVSTRERVLSAMASGLALFLGLWTKLLFAWWLPAIVLLGQRELRTQGRPLRESAFPLLALALAAGLPTLVLLSSTDNEGHPYYASVARARVSVDAEKTAGTGAHLGRYLWDGSLAAARTLELPSFPTDYFPAVLAASLLLGAARWRPALRNDILLLLACFALTFAFSLPSPYTRWPHHVVLAVVFLVMALSRVLDELPPLAFATAAAAVGVVWLSLAFRLPRSTPLLESSFEKDALLRFVRVQGLDRRTLQVHTSWGTYYIAQLFGDPARAIVYLKALPDDERRLRETRRLADEIGRPLLLVSSRRRQRFETPELVAVLGEPSETHRFGDWRAILYGSPP